jgi:hypothetical protein
MGGIEMGSDAMIYIPSFMQIGSGFQKDNAGVPRHKEHGERISLLFSLLSLFFKKKGN